MSRCQAVKGRIHVEDSFTMFAFKIIKLLILLVDFVTDPQFTFINVRILARISTPRIFRHRETMAVWRLFPRMQQL